MSTLVLFCPACERYLGRANHCRCGWERPLALDQLAPRHVAELDQPVLAPPLLLMTAPPLIVWGFGRPGEGQGGLIALDVQTGKEAWQLTLPAAVTGAALAPDMGTLVISCDDGRLHGLRLSASGPGHALTRQWTAELHGAIEAPVLMPATRAEFLCLAVTAQGVIAHVDWRTGKIVKQTHVERLRLAATPRWVGQQAIVGGLDHRRQGGDKLLSVDLNHHVHEVATTATGIYTTPLPLPGGGGVVVGCRNGDLLALEVPGGRQIWRFAAGKLVRATPTASNDLLYVGDGARHLHALSLRTGKPIWTFDWQHSIHTTPAVVGNLLFLADTGGCVVALDLRTAGQDRPPVVVWEFYAESDRPGSACAMPAAQVVGGFAIHQGILWFGSANGRIYRSALYGDKLAWARDDARSRGSWLEVAAATAWLDPRAGGDAAAQLLEQEKEHQWAAAIYETLGQTTRAAEAYEKAGKTTQLPLYYSKAADLWARLKNKARADQCRQHAAHLGRKPLLDLVSGGASELRVGDIGLISLEIRNTGHARACRIVLTVHATAFAPVPVEEWEELLENREPLRCKLSLRPHESGDLDLTLRLSAEDEHGNTLPALEWPLQLRCAAALQRPIQQHIEKQFNGPTTVHESDGDMVLIQRGRSGALDEGEPRPSG